MKTFVMEFKGTSTNGQHSWRATIVAVDKDATAAEKAALGTLPTEGYPPFKGEVFTWKKVLTDEMDNRPHIITSTIGHIETEGLHH